jgi:hypothetical protein
MPVEIELDKTNQQVAEQLFPLLFLLRVRREAFPWEKRLGIALVFDELTVKNPPRDVGLRQVFYAAEDVKATMLLYKSAEDQIDRNLTGT